MQHLQHKPNIIFNSSFRYQFIQS